MSDPARLVGAIKTWLSAPGPALLSVLTDPDADPITFDKTLRDLWSPMGPFDDLRG